MRRSSVAAVLAVTPSARPSAPTNVIAAVLSDTEIGLEWEYDADWGDGTEGDFVIEYRLDGVGDYVFGGSISGVNIHNVSGLQAETTYNFRVIARNEFGRRSVPSSSVTETTDPEPEPEE